MTALCAGGYALFCLRELPAYRNELLVADCLGVVSLLVARLPSRKLQLAWLAAPAVWSLGFAWGLFYLSSPHESVSLHYFLMLLGASIVLFSGATLLGATAGISGPWSSQVFFYFAAFLLLTNNHYPMAANYNNALCLALSAPAILPANFWWRGCWPSAPRSTAGFGPRRTFGGWTCLSLVLIAAALVDLRLSQIMGVRWTGMSSRSATARK